MTRTGQVWPVYGASDATVTSDVSSILSRLESLGILIEPASGTTYNEEFSNGTYASDWAWFNPSNSTVSVVENCLVMQIDGNSGDNLRIFNKPLPESGNTNYTVTMRGWMQMNDFNTQLGGLVLRESTSSKIQVMVMGHFGSGPTYRIGVSSYNSVNGFNAHNASVDLTSYAPTLQPFEFRAQKSGNTLNWRYSFGDGGYYQSLHSAAETASFTTRADRFGLFANTTSLASAPIAVAAWFRVTLP